MNDIKKMFAEVTEKIVKEQKDISEDSILHRVMATNIDHYKLCPFRSMDERDCPLCKLAGL